MSEHRALAWLLAFSLTACGSARPLLAETPVPASDRDPAPYAPTPSAHGQTGQPIGLVVSGGDDQARQVLVAIVLAMRDGDESEITRMLAERIGHAAGTGAAHTTWPRRSMAHQLAAASTTSHLDPDASFDSLVDPATIRVVTAAAHFTNGLPVTVVGTDLVVLFSPTPVGRRALAGLASGVLVVRPGPEPIVVAR